MNESPASCEAPNAEAIALLARIAAYPVDYETADVALMRARAAAFPAPPADQRGLLLGDTAIPIRDGAVSARHVRPADRSADDRRSCLVYFHGGGWVMNRPADFDALLCALARHGGLEILAPAYALAPERRFPFQVRQCAEIFHALAADNREAGRQFILAGDSAGGNLAVAALLYARDHGMMTPDGLLLIYPVLDRDTSGKGFERLGEAYLLGRSGMEWCWRHYLAAASDGDLPYASPLRAAHLAGFPPTMILSASHCPLTDQAERFAIRLRAAGAAVRHDVYPSIHAFLQFAQHWPVADKAVRDVAEWLNEIGLAGECDER